MTTAFIKTSLAAGEISPSLFGHTDLVRYQAACSTLRNMFVSYRGGVFSRAGFAFVGFSKQTGRQYPPRLISFAFSVTQGLALEFGDFYMRVISNGAFVTEPPVELTGATQANPCVITLSPTSSWAAGDRVYLAGIGGMTQLNGRTVVLGTPSGNLFPIEDAFGDAIDSTAFSAFTSTGTAARIYTLTTPWAEADLVWLKYVESADVMTICCVNQQTLTEYPAYDLERFADDDWSIEGVVSGPSISSPSSASGSASASGSIDYQYVATAVSGVDGTESRASSIASINNAVRYSQHSRNDHALLCAGCRRTSLQLVQGGAFLWRSPSCWSAIRLCRTVLWDAIH